MSSTREEKIAGLKQMFESYKQFSHPRPGMRYSSLADLVYKEGSLLSSEPFSFIEEMWLRELFKHTRDDTMRECYRNATQLLIGAKVTTEDMNWRYGEGYGVNDLNLPFEHAVLIMNGKPVDITWRENRKDRRYNPEALLERAKYNLANNVYWMVSFQLEYVMKFIIGSGTYGVLEFNRALYENGVPK